MREFTIDARSPEHWEQILRAIGSTRGARVIDYTDRTFAMHRGGKIEQHNKYPLKTRDDLSMAYTPGVARVCTEIAQDRSKAFEFTIKKNTVAVVTDGSAVLGLGDIGPEASMPVMEGKAMLFKEFADVDAFPIALSTQDPDKIVETVKLLAPGFGGINLEDISAPRCFEIEDRLRDELDIPVFHDDQHGTAVVVMAALFNALKIVGKPIESLRVVMVGLGAAGIACTKMMMAAGVTDIIGCDRRGAISTERDRLRLRRHAADQEVVRRDLQPGAAQRRPQRGARGRRPVHRPLRPRPDRRRLAGRDEPTTRSSSRWPTRRPR